MRGTSSHSDPDITAGRRLVNKAVLHARQLFAGSLQQLAPEPFLPLI